MSLSTQTRIRLPKIQDGLRKGLTHEQIADICGVTSRTIDRDLSTWLDSGEFETWLKQEFVELYEYVREANPTIAFKEMARLMGKMVTRKAEIKAIEETREIKVVWTMNNDRLLKGATDSSNQIHTPPKPTTVPPK